MSTHVIAEPMPGVRRIEGQRGSFIDPPLDPAWSDLGKLRWKLSVVSLDAGLSLKVAHFTDYDTFGIFGHGRSMGAEPYDRAWRSLSNLATGAEMARDSCPSRACGEPA